MPEASARYNGKFITITAESGLTAGQVIQLKDGRAGFADADITSGNRGEIQVQDVARIAKTSGIVILDGGQVWWDHSANQGTYKPVDDRDFYVGVAVGDWASGETFVDVALNVQPTYLLDIMRDGYRSTVVGTQALGGLAIKRNGGCLNFVLSSTSEAQKLDALSVAGFSKDANAIVEIIFAVPNDGAGTVVDVSLGVANGTDSANADLIAESIFVHLDANNANINLESDDGTTEVAATDSTYDYTEGSAVANLVYVWFDMRNPASVKIYVNGVQALAATTFNVNAAVGPFKLLAHIEKSSAADVYELDLHALRARIAEQ